MQCRCGKSAVIYRRHDGQALCKDHFVRAVESRVRKTIRQAKLIDPKDHIAVGISGGKDSALSLYMMREIAKRDKRFTVSAIIVDEGIDGYRTLKPAKDFCDKLGIKLHVISFKDVLGMSLDKMVAKAKGELRDRKEQKTHSIDDDVGDVRACTYCGVFRRLLLNMKAREIGATKLVIGHNLDDEVQSIFANYIRGDLLRAARLGAKAFIVKDDRFVPRIKPLRNIPEKEVALYCMIKGWDVDFAECPYASESFRWDVRDMINGMEAKYPGTKHSIMATFDRMLPDLQKKFKGQAIESCKVCKEPASGGICKACQLREKLGI